MAASFLHDRIMLSYKCHKYRCPTRGNSQSQDLRGAIVENLLTIAEYKLIGDRAARLSSPIDKPGMY